MMGIVWIISTDARVFRFSETRMERTSVQPTSLEAAQEQYFLEVSKRIADAQKLLLLGPDQVKDHFAEFLISEDPRVAQRIVARDAMASPDDAQIALLARKHFKIR